MVLQRRLTNQGRLVQWRPRISYLRHTTRSSNVGITFHSVNSFNLIEMRRIILPQSTTEAMFNIQGHTPIIEVKRIFLLQHQWWILYGSFGRVIKFKSRDFHLNSSCSLDKKATLEIRLYLSNFKPCETMFLLVWSRKDESTKWDIRFELKRWKFPIKANNLNSGEGWSTKVDVGNPFISQQF